MAAARAKMIARRFGGKDVSKTGGKGSRAAWAWAVAAAA